MQNPFMIKIRDEQAEEAARRAGISEGVCVGAEKGVEQTLRLLKDIVHSTKLRIKKGMWCPER